MSEPVLQHGVLATRAILQRVPGWKRREYARANPRSCKRCGAPGACTYPSCWDTEYLLKAYPALRGHAAGGPDPIPTDLRKRDLGGDPEPVPAPVTASTAVLSAPVAPVASVPVAAPPAPAGAAGDLGAALGNVFQTMLQAALGEKVAALEAKMTAIAKDVGQYRGVAATLADGKVRKIDGLFHASFDRVCKYVGRGDNVMLVGPAGCGKSEMAMQVAKFLGLDFHVTSVAGGTSESVFLGKILPVGDQGKFVWMPSAFVTAYETGGLFCCEEMDGAADPSVYLTLNNALAQGFFDLQIRFGDRIVKRHANFRFIGIMNTFGMGGDRVYVGRSQLDGATLDRFSFIEMGYDNAIETKLVAPKVLAWGTKVRKVIEDHKIRRILSTRWLVKMSMHLEAGDALSECARLYFTPWSVSESTKVPAELRGE